jgi:hypothetical protein
MPGGLPRLKLDRVAWYSFTRLFFIIVVGVEYCARISWSASTMCGWLRSSYTITPHLRGHSSSPRASWINWLVDEREIFREFAAEAALRWLMTMMVTIKDKTMREERTPMVIIVLVFICPFSSQ